MCSSPTSADVSGADVLHMNFCADHDADFLGTTMTDEHLVTLQHMLGACLGSQRGVLLASHQCIGCTCVNFQTGSKQKSGEYRGFVFRALMEFGTMLLRTRARATSPCTQPTGARRQAIVTNALLLVAMWKRAFSQIVLSADESAKFNAMLSQINLFHPPHVGFTLLIGIEQKPGSRPNIADLNFPQSTSFLRDALAQQRFFAPIWTKDVSPLLHAEFLDMKCACSRVPRSVFDKIRAREQANASRKNNPPGHLVRDCSLRHSTHGPMPQYKADIIASHRVNALASHPDFRRPGRSAGIKYFGNHPSLSLLLEARNAMPWHAFCAALESDKQPQARTVHRGTTLQGASNHHVAKLIDRRTADKISADADARMSGVFMTLLLEAPLLPTKDVVVRMKATPAFARLPVAHVPLMAQHGRHGWSVNRHRHLSPEYKAFVWLIVLCIWRLRYGENRWHGNKRRSAHLVQEGSASWGSVEPELFMQWITPSEFRATRLLARAKRTPPRTWAEIDADTENMPYSVWPRTTCDPSEA